MTWSSERPSWRWQAQALHDPARIHWLRAAARWARPYLRTEAGDDTMNLYDTSALAHAGLVRAIRAAAGPPGLAINADSPVADLRAQLERGVARAAHDPFRAGVVYDNFDAAPHAFGLVATARLYRALTGDTRYDAFATSQRDWALGDNAWGVSLMVGVGRDFPPPHAARRRQPFGQRGWRAPLSAGRGRVRAERQRPVLGRAREPVLPPCAGARHTAATGMPPSPGHGSRFVDDVRSWQTVEPAIDFTAAASLAFALLR